MAYLGHFAIVRIYIYIGYIYIYIWQGPKQQYRVLSIYRVLPGFREFAVFKKSKRFFYIFFGWVLHRGGQGPGKGPNIRSLQVLSIYRVLPGFREFAFLRKVSDFSTFFLDGCYIEGVRALARAQIYIYIYTFVYIQGLARFSRICGFLKSKRFFYIFFWIGVTQRGSGPWQGPKSVTKPQGLQG